MKFSDKIDEFKYVPVGVFEERKLQTLIDNKEVNLAWLADPASVSYQVEFKLATATSWSLNPPLVPVTNPIDIIGGLLPDTDYYIRVNNICAGGACYSVTILIRTKQ